MLTETLFPFVLILAVILIFIMMAIRIVPEYQRLVVFRLGRFIGGKGPGLDDVTNRWGIKVTAVEIREAMTR